MSAIQIHSWQTLPSEGGGSLALDGDRIAVASPARLSVWQGSTRIAKIEALFSSPGVPRFARQKVFWGPGVLDLMSGEYKSLQNAQPEVRPGGGERPHVYAWSPSGDRLVGAFSTGDPGRPVRIVLYNGDTGAAVVTLWEGSALPPQAAWIGERAAVVGFGSPRVFDYSGRQVTSIALDGANIAAIAAPDSERRLMVLDLNRNIAWIDTATWAILNTWSGPWMHAAVSPDGRLVVALEAWGKLHFASIANDVFRPAGVVEVDSNAAAVALSTDRIATSGGGEVRWTKVAVNPATSFP